jgi:hypothetical protein
VVVVVVVAVISWCLVMQCERKSSIVNALSKRFFKLHSAVRLPLVLNIRLFILKLKNCIAQKVEMLINISELFSS